MFKVTKKWIINETTVANHIYNTICDYIETNKYLDNKLSLFILEEHKKLITCWWFFNQLFIINNIQIKKKWEEIIQSEIQEIYQ